MKFSNVFSLVLVAAALPAATVAVVPTPPVLRGLPPRFVQQCCTPNPPPEGVPAFIATTEYRVAGYNSPTCLADGGPGCIDLVEVCATLVVNPDTDLRGEPCQHEAPYLLNCCIPDTAQVIGDIMWTCAARIGASIATNDGPTATENGYYCGYMVQCKTGVTCGDPHLKTWSGEWFDFHGECDLTFVEAKEFGQGLGMTVHIRTTGRHEYSYIEAAALKIGDDVLEVGSYGEYFYNGVQNANLDGVKMAGLYPIEYARKDINNHVFNITTGNKFGKKEEIIQLKATKEMIGVMVMNGLEETFGDSVGLMGNYTTGHKLSRDGKLIRNHDEFGMEWQVRPEEPKLFQTIRAPQLPEQKCNMPSKGASAQRRRLGETVALDAAEDACNAATGHVNFEHCVYDVMATGDLEAVNAGVF